MNEKEKSEKKTKEKERDKTMIKKAVVQSDGQALNASSLDQSMVGNSLQQVAPSFDYNARKTFRHAEKIPATDDDNIGYEDLYANCPPSQLSKKPGPASKTLFSFKHPTTSSAATATTSAAVNEISKSGQTNAEGPAPVNTEAGATKPQRLQGASSN